MSFDSQLIVNFERVLDMTQRQNLFMKTQKLVSLSHDKSQFNDEIIEKKNFDNTLNIISKVKRNQSQKKFL